MLNANVSSSFLLSKAESEPLHSNQVICRIRRVEYEKPVKNSPDLSGRFHGELHAAMHIHVLIRKQNDEIIEHDIIMLPHVRVHVIRQGIPQILSLVTCAQRSILTTVLL